MDGAGSYCRITLHLAATHALLSPFHIRCPNETWGKVFAGSQGIWRTGSQVFLSEGMS